MVRMVTIFVASPGDVTAEREQCRRVAEALNRTIADERDVQFKVVGYKTDVRPRVHRKGPQGADLGSARGQGRATSRAGRTQGSSPGRVGVAYRSFTLAAR